MTKQKLMNKIKNSLNGNNNKIDKNYDSIQ